MVKLADEDVKTREVLGWKGLHLFHYAMSSCSQKLRIFLNLKKVAWEPHEVDLLHNENINDWFLGINPRGLVPVLVHDGAVHIESNDILLYLEKLIPEPPLIPRAAETEMAEMLHKEDDLHLDFRALSFRFLFNPPTTPKTPDVIERYGNAGSGTVDGVADEGKAREIRFWKNYAVEGITDATVQAAVAKFRAAFDDLEKRLETQTYLLGQRISLLDIAWFIYVNRLTVAGYPFARLHPRLAAWFAAFQARPEFASEIIMPPPLRDAVAQTHREQAARQRTLVDVAGL